MSNRGDAARCEANARIEDIAEILAAGIIQLTQPSTMGPNYDSKNSQIPRGPGLEVSGETRLSVRVG